VCKKAEASFWKAKEIDLSTNHADLIRSSPTEQHFISLILAFFAASNGIINENLSGNFATKVIVPEAQFFYGFQIVV
jgi:ribonucleotide reductase beta subunit family protein with ferritin-like domain